MIKPIQENEKTEERKGTIESTSNPQLKFEDDEDGDEESIEDEDEGMDDGEEDEMDDEEEDFDEEDGNIEENEEDKTNQKLVNEAGKTCNEPQPEKLDGKKVKSEDDINGVQNEKQKVIKFMYQHLLLGMIGELSFHSKG